MKKYNTEDFIRKAKDYYGDKYTYDKVVYVNKSTPVIITCKLHGDFSRKPVDFLSKHQGCRTCGIIKRVEASKFSNEDFIKKAIIIHGDRYDYSKVNYTGSHNNITIICKVHGEFIQRAYSHLSGHNCPKCGDLDKSKNKLKTVESFIEEANRVHYNKYNYDSVNYVGNKTAIKIYCPDHGAFYQTPQEHLKGCGCPICSGSNGEQIIWQFLKKNNINFVFQKKFKNCKNKTFLPFDFYLPDYNIAIEYQGEQHFKYTPFFDKDVSSFKERQIRDAIKKNFCMENDIIYFPILYNQPIIDCLEEMLL